MELYFKGKRIGKKKLGQYKYQELIQMQKLLNHLITTHTVVHDLARLMYYQKIITIELKRRDAIKKTNSEVENACLKVREDFRKEKFTCE